MVGEFVKLRNDLHRGKFRFELPSELWKLNYIGRPGVEEDDIVKIYRNGELKGYAICSLSDYEPDLKMYRILELCAAEKEIMEELIDSIIVKGEQRGADFIIIRRCGEPFEDLFDKTGFLNLKESVIMVVLLNPRELLVPLSEEDTEGRSINLNIHGFEPISLIVGRDKIRLLEHKSEPDLVLSMSDKVFLRLFFGKTSMVKEFLRGNIQIKGKIYINTATRFFRVIKQANWYIPPGDWA